MFASTVPARGRCRASRPPVCVARAAPPASAPANAVELEDLVDIIKAVDSSDVVEMELTGKKFSMTVKKQEALQPAEPTYVQAPVAGATLCCCDHMTARGALSRAHMPLFMRYVKCNQAFCVLRLLEGSTAKWVQAH